MRTASLLTRRGSGTVQEGGDVITACKRSLGQGNIFTPVCPSVHRGGVCLSACWDTTPTFPGTMHPPGPCTPLPQDHAPPGAQHAGRYGQRAGGTNPTGMQFCVMMAPPLDSTSPYNPLPFTAPTSTPSFTAPPLHP